MSLLPRACTPVRDHVFACYLCSTVLLHLSSTLQAISHSDASTQHPEMDSEQFAIDSYIIGDPIIDINLSGPSMKMMPYEMETDKHMDN